MDGYTKNHLFYFYLIKIEIVSNSPNLFILVLIRATPWEG